MLTTPDDPLQSVGQLKYRNLKGTSTNVLCGHYRLKDDIVAVVVHRHENNTKRQAGNNNKRNRRNETIYEIMKEQIFHLVSTYYDTCIILFDRRIYYYLFVPFLGISNSKLQKEETRPINLERLFDIDEV